MPHEAPDITLQAVGEEGERWGRPLSLVSSETHLGGDVTCGWNGRDVVVVWTQGPLPELLRTERVRPTFF